MVASHPTDASTSAANQTLNSLPVAARSTRVTDIFVKRPVVAFVISAALILIGLRSALDLPVLQYPKIESASLVITTPYIGASAETVQGFITDVIERAASSVPGIDYIDSITQAGLSTVTAYLELNEDSTAALAELSSRISQVRFELPAGAEDPAVSVVRADRPTAAWYLDVLMDEGVERADVTDYLSRSVVPQLSSISGVQEVRLLGDRDPAMRIWLDPDRLASYDISTQDIEQALQLNNIIATVGASDNGAQRIDLLMDATLTSVEDFTRIVVRESNGTLVRLGDIADVKLGEIESTAMTRLLQETTVFLAIYPLPGTNEIDIADRMYVVLDEVNKSLPDGITIDIGFDVTTYMRAALKEIFITLIETVLLVGLVVIFFMGSFRTALVPLVTIPISLLGAVGAMAIMGFSLNLLTVLAVVLSVGLVVDDAIVVVENVARHIRNGMNRFDAALASSRQLFSPIIAMTLTLAAVYAPIGFLSGLTGVLFKEFAFTLAIAVLISGFVALTLSPIMSAYAIPPNARESHLSRRINAGFLGLQNAYRKVLTTLLQHNGKVLFVASFIAVLAVPFFLFSKSELAPTEDESRINVVVSGPPEASLAYTERYMHSVVAAMEELPGTDIMWQVLTGSGAYSGMQFKPFEQRDKSVHEMLPIAFGSLSQIGGVSARPVLPSALPTAGRFQIELVVMAPDDAETMLPYASQIVQTAMRSGKFMWADSDLRIDLPQATFKLDRERIADLGMDVADVSRQLGLFLSGNFVNRFDLDGRAYRVIPMIVEDGRPNPGALMNLKIRTPDGDLLPLSALATLEESVAPRLLGKFQQNNAFRIIGGLLPGITPDQGLLALEEIIASVVPVEYSIDYAGESRQQHKEGNTLIGVLGFSLAFVFMALAIQFNSIRDPLVVLLGSAPLAISGALLFTYFGWTTINIYSQVGFITLVGLIAKNAILVVEFARQLQIEGASKLDAIRESAVTRLRPVLMTTGATVMGHFPLVLVAGAGAEARNSIGIILVAGMLIGTLFTLVILPSVYLKLATNHYANQQKNKNSRDQTNYDASTADTSDLAASPI